MEDKLSEAQVTVLADRSTGTEKRNLRWDLLPVAAPGGLLHAKAALLLWKRAGRIILGSANLTPAGYRQQIEAAIAIDLDDNCTMPRAVMDDLVAELRLLVALAPDDPGPAGPKSRAMATVDLLASRIGAMSLPVTGDRNLRVAVAPARPGTNPLAALPSVWRGPQPLRATVLSPFWDDVTPAPALAAVRALLTGRPAYRRAFTAVAAVDPRSEAVKAPASMARHKGLDLVAFEPDDAEQRLLHAKVLVIESDDWLAAMVGSSNATEAGYGLHPRRGHHELNVWIGCPAGSKEAKALQALARAGQALDLDEVAWEPDPDEDEPTAPKLPLGFESCLVHPEPPSVTLTFAADDLPEHWVVLHPERHRAHRRHSMGRRRHTAVPDRTAARRSAPRVPGRPLVRHDRRPPGHVDRQRRRSRCPATARRTRATFPWRLLLEALASTRPLPEAVERELRRLERATDSADRGELDPLKRFDDRALLLQRTRRVSLALWRLEERLRRPATSLDALQWRLQGPFGPVAIANGLLAAADAGEAPARRAPLPHRRVGPHRRRRRLALRRTVAASSRRSPRWCLRAMDAIDERRSDLGPAEDDALERYVSDALKAARR